MSALKHGVYQLQVGNKEVKVAQTLRKLKQRLKTPAASYRNGIKRAPTLSDARMRDNSADTWNLIPEKKIDLAEGGTFIFYTPKNQEGIRFKVEEHMHEGGGYMSKMHKGKVGGTKTVRARLIYQPSK